MSRTERRVAAQTPSGVSIVEMPKPGDSLSINGRQMTISPPGVQLPAALHGDGMAVHGLPVPLMGFGVAALPSNKTRWVAYQCATDGTVHVFTPLHNGALRGELKHVAVARLKRALMAEVAGIGKRGAA